MKFGVLPLSQALGAILAHTLRVPGGPPLKKGHVLSGGDLERLRAAGQPSVIAAELEPGDVVENDAAARIAQAVTGPGLRIAEASTGRVNVYAAQPGLFAVERAGVDRLNAVDEAVTLATVAPELPVQAGALLATVKIMPFSVSEATLARCAEAAGGPLLSLLPFRPLEMGLLLSRLPVVPESLLDRAAAAQRVRAERLSSRIKKELRCPHEVTALASGLRELLADGCSPILVLGASAIVDRRDVVPQAVEHIGGTIERFGMPVDPGNLLLLSRHGATRILGVPGCARSLRRSGYDWVLEQLSVGREVTAPQLATLGVGGLLGEIPARPQPRTGESEHGEPRIGAIVLCAGRSQRMGGTNKLLAELDGKPVVAHAVDAVLASSARPVVVVTGHEPERVQAALAGRAVRFVHNPDYAAGMSTSLRVGALALSAEADGLLICLGDMPRIRPAELEAVIGAFDPDDGRSLVLPTYRGQRGHPVLISARYLPALAELSGDVGARAILKRHAESVCTVPVEHDGVLTDVDTPEALEALSRPCPT